MSQNTSVESSTRSSPNPSINPALQAALSSLDVQLEEELARYRRQRAGHPVMSNRGLARHQTPKTIELMSVNTASGKTQQPALGMSTAPPIMSLPLIMVNQTPAAAPPKETNQEPMAQTGQQDTLSIASEPGSPLVISSPTTNTTADHSATEESVTKQVTPPEKPAEGEGDLVTSAADQTQPEGYLESSEKLLQSLADDEVGRRAEKRSTNKLLSPLGIGSLLLLLLSGATVLYIAMNPSTLSALGLKRFFDSKKPTTTQSPTETTVAKGEPVKNSPLVNGPNLASDEFVDLNLNTLSHLEASPTPSLSPSPVAPLPDLPTNRTTSAAPSVVPNSALPRGSSDLSSALLPPALPQRAVVPTMAVPSVAPIPAQRASAPPATQKQEASPSPVQVATSPASGRDQYYRVLINDVSDRALQQVKKIVPDAYVLNLPEGARISLGAFKKESEAKTLVEELRQQGISASINRP